jgi:hypothetical protein
MSKLLTILLGVLLVVFLLASFVFAVNPAGEYNCSNGVCTLEVPVEIEIAKGPNIFPPVATTGEPVCANGSCTPPLGSSDIFPGAKHNPVEPVDIDIYQPDPRISEPIVGGPYPDLGYGDIVDPPRLAPLRYLPTKSACGSGACNGRARSCGARIRARVRGFRLFRRCR